MGSKVDMVSGVIKMLVCKTHKSLENQRKNNGGSVGKSYSLIPEG
jgi:hypothetical protein